MKVLNKTEPRQTTVSLSPGLRLPWEEDCGGEMELVMEEIRARESWACRGGMEDEHEDEGDDDDDDDDDNKDGEMTVMTVYPPVTVTV